MTQTWAWLEATALASGLRDSVWIYPLINAGHVLGVALLVGSILPLDLRLLGLWRSVPLTPWWRVATQTAVCGLLLAFFSGSLLFMARATEYVASPLFQAKIALIAVAALNALLLRRRASHIHELLESGAPSWQLRLAAGLSLVGWIGVLFLGRLVGYF